jgi:hypothetical protein
MSNLVDHAKFELRKMLASEEEMDKMMAEGVIQVVETFAGQSHSGYSAAYAASLLDKLLRFEPIGPLTGEDDEWVEVLDGLFQNRRCSHVFKAKGQAYDIEGRIFRYSDGGCFTRGDSRVNVEFPYTPKHEYIDVTEDA